MNTLEKLYNHGVMRDVAINESIGGIKNKTISYQTALETQKRNPQLTIEQSIEIAHMKMVITTIMVIGGMKLINKNPIAILLIILGVIIIITLISDWNKAL